MNHATAILAAPALIYSTYLVLVVWIIVAHFHLCSLLGTLSRHTVLKVWAVRRPMRVCCGSRWGRCMLFINILDSLMAPCLVYNTNMHTVYGWCGQYGRCMVHTLADAWFIRTQTGCNNLTQKRQFASNFHPVHYCNWQHVLVLSYSVRLLHIFVAEVRTFKIFHWWAYCPDFHL